MSRRRAALKKVDRPLSSLSEAELAELRQQFDAFHALLMQCSRYMAAIEHRLLGLQQYRYYNALRMRVPPLTRRETDVLRLLARDLDTNEIAQELGVTPGTVKNHVASMMPKLGTSNRYQAVALAQVLGLI